MRKIVGNLNIVVSVINFLGSAFFIIIYLIRVFGAHLYFDRGLFLIPILLFFLVSIEPFIIGKQVLKRTQPISVILGGINLIFSIPILVGLSIISFVAAIGITD
jgi:hypothetical protein